MRQTFIFTLLTLLFFGAVVKITAQAAAAEKAITSYIAKEAKEQDADEYAEARKIIYGDLDNDGDKDAVVQYTLEGFGGGNNFAQILAIFINRKGVYKFAAEDGVGGKMGDHTSTLKRVTGKNIYLEIESCPEPPQGICQNPKKGQMTVNFRNGKIIKSRGTKF